MNGGSTTAFLPKFVGFPPLRGLHSSTVQLWRAPVPGMACAGAPCRTPRSRDGRGARDACRHSKSPFPRRSCTGAARTPLHEKQVVRQAWNAARMRPKPPDSRSSSRPSGHPGQDDAGPAQVRTPRSVDTAPRREEGRRQSAASPAAATAPAPAGRPATAGVPPAVSVAAGGAGVSPADPPAAAVTAATAAAARTGGRPCPATRRPPGAAPAGLGDERPDQYDSDHRQDDAYDHGVTLLSFPRSGPPWAPRSCVRR
jgi:hypothetical protein